MQIGTDTDWRFIAAGSATTAAIKTNGTLWTWGYNEAGKLGDGTMTNRSSPVQVGTDTDWSTVDVGRLQTAAIKTNGTLWRWGWMGNTIYEPEPHTFQTTPVQATLANNWASVAVGDGHIMAIKTDGSLWGYGENGFGQVGCSSCPSGFAGSGVATFTKIGDATNWTSVAAGNLHTIATRSDGTLWGWGWNTYGQAGDGTAGEGVSTPTQIGSGTAWARPAAAGEFHSLAVDAG